MQFRYSLTLYLSILFIIIISLTESYANPDIDSLKHILKRFNNNELALSGSEQVNLYNRLANYYNKRNTEKSTVYAYEALRIAKSNHSPTGIAHSMGMIGSTWLSKGEYDSARYYYTQSLLHFTGNKDSFYMAKMYNNLGLLYDFKAETEKAVRYYMKSLEIKKILNDTVGIITCLNNIGASFFSLEQYDDALKYYEFCLPLEKAVNDNEGLAMTNLNIGEVLRMKQVYAKAEKHLLRAHAINNEVKSNYLQSMICDNLGLLYMSLGKKQNALYYFNEAIRINKILSDHDALSNNYMCLGEFYLESRNISKAEKYYLQAVNICTRAGFISRASEAAKALSEIYVLKNNYSRALHYYQMYSDLRDSVFNIESKRQITEMKTKYETEKKEKKLAQKEIELTKSNAKIKKQKIITAFSLGGIITILLFSLFIYREYIRKNEAYRKLVRKNIEAVRCDQYNKKVIDEINTEAVEKYKNSNLSDTQKNNILNKLQILLKDKRIYQNPSLSIDELAIKLNTNRSYLSQIINEFYNQNYYTFINELRVREARRIFANPEYKKLSIEGIARQVGFNSKSSFNTAFKKFTGVTPSYFAKTVQHEQMILS